MAEYIDLSIDDNQILLYALPPDPDEEYDEIFYFILETVGGPLPDQPTEEQIRRNRLLHLCKRNHAGDEIDLLVDNREDVVQTLQRFNRAPVHRLYEAPLNEINDDIRRHNRNNQKCETAFNIFEQADVDIIRYLNVELEDDEELNEEEREKQRRKRIVFFVGETPDNLTPYTSSLDYLLYNLHNIIISTDCQNPVTGRFYIGSGGSDMINAIYQIQLTSRYPVFLTNLIDVLTHTDKRVFVILPFYQNEQRVQIERSATLGNLGQTNLLPRNHEPNGVSGWHCQVGTNMNMYSIQACEGRGDNPLFPVCSDE